MSDYPHRFVMRHKSNMAKYLFGGFEHCLYPVQKFHSEAERILAVILERDAEKWFKPAKQLEYQPDFVAETGDAIYMLEPKAKNRMNDVDVIAKKEAAVLWCERPPRTQRPTMASLGNMLLSLTMRLQRT